MRCSTPTSGYVDAPCTSASIDGSVDHVFGFLANVARTNLRARRSTGLVPPTTTRRWATFLSMAEEIAGAVSFDEANVVQRGMRLLAGTRPMAWLFARVLHHLDGPVLRRSAGRHSVSAALTGLPIIELTTVGARSGESRTLPLVGVPDGVRLVLVASNYGKQQNPAWYYNLKANPRCTATFRGQRHDMEAYEAEGEERQRLWELDVSVYPPRNHYAHRAGTRRIPVVVLRPAPKATG
jgi:deazaflavin-dependent oxidoreductase (nitroreductase family)